VASAGSAQVSTIFSDNFDPSIGGWALSGNGAANWYAGAPHNGTHSVELTWARRMERTISTACYQNVSVSFNMAAFSLEGADYVRASWYDGSSWQTLKQINNGDPEERRVFTFFTYALPGFDNNPSFALRFEVSGNNNQDFGYVDDVLVQGELIPPYTLSLTGTGSGQIRVNGTLQSLPWSGNFDCGSVVSLEAVPDTCYQFDNWTGSLIGNANPTTITMDSAKAVTANFSQVQYTLDLTGVGSGSVLVDGVPQTLPWSGIYLCGTVVSIEAVPDTCYQFDNWTGDLVTTANPTTVTMDSAKAVTANFSQAQYTLDLTGVGSGSVLVDGVPQTLPWSGVYLCGTVVSIEAVPGTCYQFDNWSGDLSGSVSPTTITMDGNKSVIANFSQIVYTLDLTGVGSGQVRVDGTLHALPWSGSIPCGSVVSLEAVADAGWQFDHWSGDLTGSTNPTTITMDADKAVTANFSRIRYRLSLSATGSGQVWVNGTLQQPLPWSGDFDSGTVVNLEAVPALGWSFLNWSGSVNSPSATIAVTMDGNKAITANFTQQFVLALTKTGNGSVQVNGTLHSLPWSGAFAPGASVTLKAVPDSGWQFLNWSGDANWPGSTLTLTITSNKSIVANFSSLPGTYYKLTLTKVGNGSVRVNGDLHTLPWSGSFLAGTPVTLQAVPDASWYFAGWSGDVTGSANPILVTMDSDQSITASFTEETLHLELAAVSEGSIKLDGETVTLPYSGEVGYGTSITLEAVAVHGYRFQEWSGSATGTDNPLEFAMEDDASITAIFFVPPTYHLTITKTGSGSVSVDGEVVSLPWTGDFLRGAEVELEAEVTVDQEFLEWSGEVTGTARSVTVLMDGDSEVLASFKCIETFPDVPCDYWSYGEVEAAHACDIVEGFKDGLYRPRLIVNRAAMAVFIARALCGGVSQVPAGPPEPTFTDVPLDYWAYDEIEYAVANKVVVGYGNDTYQPSWQVTRGMMAVFVARSIVTPTGEDGLIDYVPPAIPTFPDVATTYWSYKHVEYLAEHDVVVGYRDGFYRPGSNVPRDEMAVYIRNAFELPMM
jgi:hypothetical protein